jgi:phosphoglycolate phosphatase-like HAD superfamily hydrolase
MSYRSIIFDLDGTLIDQFKAIHRAFSEVIVGMGYDKPSFETVKRAIGGASESTMAKLIGPDRAKEGVLRLRPIFEEVMLEGLVELPFAQDSLCRLKENGWKTAVLTNKYGPHARKVCDFLGFSEYLEFTLGADDTVWKKPDILLSEFALTKLQSIPSKSIYVGDSPFDYETAKNASLRCLLVDTGTHTFDELSLLNQGHVYKDLKSVTDYILNL